MIIAVEDFRKLVDTDISDNDLKLKLSGIETAIRKYTNNHFTVRTTVQDVLIQEGKITLSESVSLVVGDTIEILSPVYQDLLFTVKSVGADYITVEEKLRWEGIFQIVLVSYPDDIKVGCVNLMKWDISNREKIGIKSESISRWSVTYFDMDSNSLLGYPSSLVKFLDPYKKVRF